MFYINSWEEGPLQVEPLEKTVVLTDTQLQVSQLQCCARSQDPLLQSQRCAGWYLMCELGKHAWLLSDPGNLQRLLLMRMSSEYICLLQWLPDADGWRPQATPPACQPRAAC